MRRTFILLFGTLIFLTLVLSAGLSWQVAKFVRDVDTREKSSVVMTTTDSVSLKDVVEFCAGLQKYLAVMALVLVGGLVFSLRYLLRRVILPLEELKRATSFLADGKLDALEHSVATTQGPIKAILENIHDLAINLQEVLLLVWNLSSNDVDIIEDTLSKLTGDSKDESYDEIVNNLKALNKNLLDRQELVQQFDFFHVTIQEKKLFAEEDSANFKNCEESCHG